MSRKDFEAIAAALRASRRPIDHASGATDSQWRATRDAIADVLYASNGRFDRGRFERACER